MKKKIILGIVALFVIAVVVYLILWYVNYKSYDQYVNQEEVIYAAENGYLMENESNLLYYVKKPDFLSFTGNLVGQTEDDRISVFLWPTLFCQEIKEQGVILKTENKEDAFLLYLDEELDYDSQKNKELDTEQAERAQELYEIQKENMSNVKTRIYSDIDLLYVYNKNISVLPEFDTNQMREYQYLKNKLNEIL